MPRAVLIAFVVSLLGNLALGASGSLANGGILPGRELIAIGGVAFLSGVAFLANARWTHLSVGLTVFGFAVSSVVFSSLILLGPLAFLHRLHAQNQLLIDW